MDTNWYAMKRNGMKVATIREQHGTPVVNICRMADGTTDAQAALVASAPALLALLKTAEAYCPVNLQDEIRKAVAKANGN